MRKEGGNTFIALDGTVRRVGRALTLPDDRVVMPAIWAFPPHPWFAHTTYPIAPVSALTPFGIQRLYSAQRLRRVFERGESLELAIRTSNIAFRPHGSTELIDVRLMVHSTQPRLGLGYVNNLSEECPFWQPVHITAFLRLWTSRDRTLTGIRVIFRHSSQHSLRMSI